MNRSIIRDLPHEELVELSMERKKARGARAPIYTEEALYAQELLYERADKWQNVNRRAYVNRVGAYSTSFICNLNDVYSWDDEYVDTRL